VDDTFLMMLNCHHEPIKFYLPQSPHSMSWEVVVDTNDPEQTIARVMAPGKALELARQTTILMREVRPETVRTL
jgi:glycogen operon protein